MSVETMVALIEGDAAEEAAGLVARARADAERLVADAEARARRASDEALARAIPSLQGEATRRVNAARLRHLEARAAVVAARVAAVFDQAGTAVGAVATGDRDRWSAAVRTLAAAALDAVGTGGRLEVRAPDTPFVADLVAAAGATTDPLADDAPAGVRAWSADGRFEVDATVPVRLARARRALAEVVATALGLGEEPGR